MNLSVGLFPNSIKNVSLKSLEGLAKGEDSSEWTKIQVGVCPDGFSIGKACVPSPFYALKCPEWEVLSCPEKVNP